MTFWEKGGGALLAARVKNIGWKVPLFLMSLLMIFVLWESLPPAFISYSQLSANQIRSFLGTTSTTSTTTFLSDWTSAPGKFSSVDNDEFEAGAKTVVNETKTQKKPAEPAKSDANGESSRVNVPISGSITNPLSTSVNTTTISEVITDPMVNSTSDVLVEDDTQLVDVSTIQAQDDPAAEEEKYLVPLLTDGVGASNQLMEYKSAAVIARTLNRTLCLVPFFRGPDKHAGSLGDNYSGLVMEERYDIEVLSKFVKVASIEECRQQCHWKLDARWRLKELRESPDWEQWFNVTPRRSINFAREWYVWNSTANLEKAMGPMNKAHCVGLEGLFPGLRWKGVPTATSTYMEPSAKVKKAADLLRARALPGSKDYMAVHWRFEESKCNKNPLGLCFVRRLDGSVIANGRTSETWETMPRDDTRGHYRTAGYNGVLVVKEDISGAIYDRAVMLGVQDIYLATDGWLRERPSSDTLRWVVEDIRSKGLNIVGLWMVGGLPNFADGFYVHPDNMAKLFGLDTNQAVNNQMIALVEHEVCSRSAVFVGSGLSTWSAAVANRRRGRRCKKELSEVISRFNLETPPEVVEQAIIDKMLTIQNVAGPICKGLASNVTMQKYEDEFPDGWLDYDACEARLLKGVGQCMRLKLSI